MSFLQFSESHVDCRKPIFAFQEVQAYPHTSIDQTRFGILKGTGKEKHILTIIRSDESSSRLGIEPPHGTVRHGAHPV